MEVQVADLYALIDRLKGEAFTGLLSIEGVGLLAFVEGGYILAIMYDGPVRDTMRVWLRPLSRAVMNLILSRGSVSKEFIVYSNGATETIPLPSLGVEEEELGISFLHPRGKHLKRVITKWLQERYSSYRVVEREVGESSIVVFSREYMDRVVDLPADVLKILVLDKGESVDREEMGRLGILVLEFPYTVAKFHKLLDEWENTN